MKPTIDIKNLGFDQGAHLVLKHALKNIRVGEELIITGFGEMWPPQLQAWARSEGHQVSFDKNSARLIRGSSEQGRWSDALFTGEADPKRSGAVHDVASSRWGLAARGAKVESNTPEFQFRLNEKNHVWTENISELYAQALSGQWNPNEAIDWSVPKRHSDELEEAVVQVMTYLIENENAALIIPTRFLGQLHPHFREVQALMAVQIADEARHVEVFTRRVLAYGHTPALSTSGGQASLKSLVDETDFSTAQFLLSVLGEGTFVNLLQFLAANAPDPLTRQIALLTSRDEIRHVAFGMSHLLYRLQNEPELLNRLSAAIIHRHENLAYTSGLNSEFFDSLILLAAGDSTPEAIASGYKKVQGLIQEMAEGRRTRLIRLGFSPQDAGYLSSLHTRNFM